MWIVKLRRNGRARRGTEQWVKAATAARLVLEGRAAVLLGGSRPVRGLEDDASPAGDSPADPARPASADEPIHLFTLGRSAVVTENATGRRRLLRFEARRDVALKGEQREVAEVLLRLGSAVLCLPPPAGRDTLVLLRGATDVAGLRLPTGAAAALDFDPLSVLPELRGLGLFPWEVLPIDHLGEEGCHGAALDDIRLVVVLEEPWYPLRAGGGFLAGVQVDSTYRDYRRQLPTGRVVRAYFTHGDRRPPRAVRATPGSPAVTSGLTPEAGARASAGRKRS